MEQSLVEVQLEELMMNQEDMVSNLLVEVHTEDKNLLAPEGKLLP